MLRENSRVLQILRLTRHCAVNVRVILLCLAILLGGSVSTLAQSEMSINVGEASCNASGNGVCAANTTSVQFVFQNASTNVNSSETLVAMVAYQNQANYGKITVSGAGATWVAGYAPPMQQGIGIAFFYGSNPSGETPIVTVSVPNADNLTGYAQAWKNLSVTEDPGSQAVAAGRGNNPTVSGTTSNSQDVIFNFVAHGSAQPSAPLESIGDNDTYTPGGPFTAFEADGITGNQARPDATGGVSIVSTAGPYNNAFTLNSTNPSLKWVSAAVALESTGDNTLYDQTPLTDYTSSQLYLGLYPGFLYNNSNSPDRSHDSDGKKFAQEVEPLGPLGNYSPTGKIGFIGIGPSNFTEELCTAGVITASTIWSCDPNTFVDQVRKLPNVNPNLLAIDCARGGQFIGDWLNISSVGWQNCLNVILPDSGITTQQVQVVTFYDDVEYSTVPLSSMQGSTCPSVPIAGQAPDACVYEYDLAQLARFLKTEFPNLKMIFLQSRSYAGYADQEPAVYETGFSTKWLIQAQVNEQENPGFIDPLAGDVKYNDHSTVWMGWGAYTWGPGPIPREDGQYWPAWNYKYDGEHPSQCFYYGPNCGRKHTADLMMDFYTTSPYATLWFLAN